MKTEIQSTAIDSADISMVDFKLLFEAAPGRFLILKPDSPNFTIAAVSNRYLEATLTVKNKIIGKSIFSVFPDNPDDPSATGVANLKASLERVVLTGLPDTMAVQRYDVPRPQSQGGGFEVKYWSPMNSPVFGENGKLNYIFHQVEDVTEFIQLKQQGEAQAIVTEALQTHASKIDAEIYTRAQEIQRKNEELRRANEQLGRLDKMKTDFFSNISHEFRTPLTLLLGPLEILLGDPSLSDDSRQGLLQIQRNGLRLLRLVNSLLDFSRMEAGMLAARFQPTDITRYTIDLASTFASAFEKAGLSLTFDCPVLPEPIYLDRDMWEKIIMNLLSNALKFTFRGGVNIKISLQDRYANIIIEDTGTGVPNNELPRLFERFHRVEGAESRSHEGTGIGLALVHELVNAHGGTISVESLFGVGTKFIIDLPLGFAHLPKESIVEQTDDVATVKNTQIYIDEALMWLPQESSSPAVNIPKHNEKVLIADDNADIRTFLATLLAPYYNVLTFKDGREALSAIQTQKPDLVLSDVMMPNMDGIQLVRMLRENPETRMLPIILLSARAGQESSFEGLSAGADDYLAKPFTAQELLARVRTHLNMARARNELMTKLKTANDELNAFSYSVSHDLQAPLRAIRGFSQIINDDYADSLEPKCREYVAKILAGSKRMGELINDLLMLSKISSNEIKYHDVDLSKIAEDICKDLKDKNPTQQIDCQIRHGLIAKGDANLLKIVLENLLGNAWKFSSKTDHAIIEFGMNYSKDNAVFFVQDNGAGFNLDYAEKLFQPFQRLHRNDEFPGTGIGLATVRRIIERHRGVVWTESKINKGATFFFTLGI